MAPGRTFAGNLTIQIVSRAAAVLIGLVTVGILSRALGTAGLGEYTTAFTFLQFFGVLVDFGLTLSFIVMISEPGADEERVASNLFTMRLVLGIVCYALAPLAALLIAPWSAGVKAGVAVGAGAYLLSSVASILLGIFQKHRVMWRAGAVELLNRAVILGFVALFAISSPGVVPMMFASVIGNAVWLFAIVGMARPFVRVHLRIDRPVWIDAARRSWPIALSTLFNLVYLRGDVLFLSFWRPAAEVGIYGLAYRVIDVLTQLPVMFMGLLLPSLVTDWKSGRVAEFRAHLAKAFDFFAILAIPIVIGAQAVAEPLVVLIAGEDYRGSGQVLQVLILSVFGVFFGGLYGWTVVSLDEQKRMIWAYGITAMLSLVGYCLFIPAYGMWGAVWVTVLSETLIGFATFAMVWMRSGALPRFATAGKALVSSIVMYVTIVALPPMHVLIHMSIGGAVFFAVMLAIKGISPQTIKDLMPRRIASHNQP